MPESPIRKLVPYAEDAKKRGIGVFHLNIGQPDIKTPEIALSAVKNTTLRTLEYAKSEGSLQYRNKIAAYYSKHNVHIDAKDIVATTGASEALLFTIGCITDIGDEIIVPEPFYANYIAFSYASGANIVPVVSSIDNDFALPKIEEFEKLINKKTKAILICNPGNPTGTLYSREELEQLKEIVLKYDLFLIADEVYREFVYDGYEHVSILSLEAMEQNAIIIDSVSKRYSMCGARVGSIISKNNTFIETTKKYAQARLSPPTYGLIASEAALDTPQSYFDEVIEEYIERRNTLVEELQKIKGIKVTKPKGAFYCLVELPIQDSDHFAQWLLEKFNHNNETVMVAPASGFYSTEGQGKNQIRIAYVLNKKDLIKSVEILGIALKEYNK